jgi:hypothetical protein
MPDFAVGTAFKGSDSLSPVFRKMTVGVDKFGRAGLNAFARMRRGASRLLGPLRGLMPAFSVAGVVRFGKASIDAFNKQQAAIANVEAGLKSTNNAIGITSKEFQKMAAATQKVGIFGDETILQNATAQLLTFGNIGKQNFDRVQKAALDVTAKLYGVKATGEQVRTTSIMMGKAMDDPIRGMGAMRRVGISFSKAEEMQIKSMVRANNMLGAQNAMLKLIERQYGGTNAELAKTNEGMEIVAKNKMGDTMELIGKQIAPLKMAFLNLAVWILPKINVALPIFIGFLKTIGPYVLALTAFFAAYKIQLMAVAAKQAILQGSGFIGFIMKIGKAIKGLTVVQWLYNAAVSANPAVFVVLKIIAVVGILIGLGYLIYKNWNKIKKVFLKFISVFKKFKIVKLYIGFLATIPKIIGAVWTWLTGKISEFARSIANFFINAKNKLVAFAEMAWQAFKKVGHVISTVLLFQINLLITGITKLFTLASKLPGVGSKFKAAAEKLAGLQASMNEAVGATNVFAPNQAETESRKIQFEGNINIGNAPKGTTVNSKTRGANNIDMNLVGQQ